MSNLQEVSSDGAFSVRWDDAKKAAGDDVIALSVADMDFAAPRAIVDAVTARAQKGNYCYTYLSDEYFQAVTSWFEHRHDWTIDSDSIVAVGRMVESVPALLRALIPAGGNVVVPYPAYAPTPAAVRAAGDHVVPWQLELVDGQYRCDFEMLEWLLQDAQALVITNPHNPTGRVWAREELTRIADIADKAGVLVISDEFHADFTYPGHDFCPYLTCGPAAAKGISYNSPGKTFNIAGLEMANIVVPDPTLRAKVRKAVDDAGCHNPRFFAEAAVVAGYRWSEEWLNELLELVWRHANELRTTIAQMGGGVRLIEPEGTYLAWIDFRALDLSDAELEKAFASHGLVMAPGAEFGAGGAGFMRINMATTDAIFAEALVRMTRTVEEHN
jgi:cystathionine beta-lyase